MRNYIILNGVNSNTITGLLISTLPPITKPKIRTQTEEIDGRDGDIVTKLGYSAYDKEIEIGLYGDFDIDNVIAYFNSEGTVTFSNEPDKFYNYQILDQIDYEKLIRFKTAKVKMHVQPFKYPLEETPVEITIQTVNNEAEEMDLDNTKEAPMTITLKGNTSQETTTSTKNIFNTNNYTNSSLRGGSYEILTSNAFSLDLTTASSYSWVYIVWKIDNLKKNTDYVIKCNMNRATEDSMNMYTVIQIVPDAETGALKIAYGILSTGVTFNSGNYETIYVKFTPNNSATANVYTLYDIQLEEGTTPTSFEPFGTTPNPDYPQDVHIVTGDNIITIENSDSSESQSYHITLPEGMYMGWIGDYQDNMYNDSGKWYIEKQIGKVVFDGTENWNVGNYGTNSYYIQLGNEKKPGDTTPNYNYSNLFRGVAYKDRASSGNNIVYVDLTLGLYARNTSYTSLADFKTMLGTNNLIYYYLLATPTTTEITDTTLIAQLEALENATSYDTKTHITQNANDKPFILNATALQQGSGEATVNNEGNIYSKPTLDIEGSGTIGIYLDGNQMFSVDLSNANECIIDTAQLEAYNPSTDALMNRQVTGDYSNFKLNAGDNQIQATGDITKVTISNYTRWL